MEVPSQFSVCNAPKEETFRNGFRLACQRKHVSDTKQSKEGVGMYLLAPIGGTVKYICTPAETRMMTLISAGNKRT